MVKGKIKNFYLYLNKLFSAENLTYLFNDEVLAKANEDAVEFTQEQLFMYLDSRINKLNEGKQLDKYIKSLSINQFKQKAKAWRQEIKNDNMMVEELLKKKVNTKEELEKNIEIIKDAYEKALKRKEYIKDLLKDENDKDIKEILKGINKLFDSWIRELDKIYEKKAKNLSKYMVKTILSDIEGHMSEEELKKQLIKLKRVKKEIMEIDAKIEVENITGNANARKVKELKAQKRLKAEKMYYKALAMKTAVEESAKKSNIDIDKDKRLQLIDRIADGFKEILDEEENARAKDKAYKQVIVDEGIEE